MTTDPECGERDWEWRTWVWRREIINTWVQLTLKVALTYPWIRSVSSFILFSTFSKSKWMATDRTISLTVSCLSAMMSRWSKTSYNSTVDDSTGNALSIVVPGNAYLPWTGAGNSTSLFTTKAGPAFLFLRCFFLWVLLLSLLFFFLFLCFVEIGPAGASGAPMAGAGACPNAGAGAPHKRPSNGAGAGAEQNNPPGAANNTPPEKA